ncbi:het domain-containing protein [Colletotrichum kahawae]|uniref:Het domain-containing protein n=1 Tax=Colletotrichum kahawae TaxID=34407 RepID=A0AAD9YBA5_COLKA|nr:het domain-containing protein [Colletotrichum kahawae]
MRLVNARTLQLEEFFGEGVPKYAILSHTWKDGQEVTFQEFSTERARNKSGWSKIERTAQLALEDKLQHVWIDTCCIDKTSSAELTEAINSMMSWYEQSQVCYTYLEDVPFLLPKTEQEDAFRNSRWFTRGWTLQELLAPSKLIFIFKDWTRFATREEMAYLISSITGIDTEFLHTLAVEENIAYCLLGIFGINMPLLYGEGSKAFLRLQEQIMMSSDDQSILAWNFEGFETEHAGNDDEDWFRDFHHFPCAFLQCRDKYAPASVVALPLKPTREGFYVRARLPLRLVDYQLLLESRPMELYALKYGDYTTRWEPRKEVTVRIRSLPKNVEVLHAWSQSGDLGPYSQIILESDGQADERMAGALLLGDRSSGKAKFILLVTLRKVPTKRGGYLESCVLATLDGVDDLWLDDKDFSRPTLQRQRYSDHLAEDLLRILNKAKQCGPIVFTADGSYSTSTETQDCFGKTVISVDVSVWPRPFDHAKTLLRRITSWFRNHVRGYSRFNKIKLLLALAPRAFTIVIEHLACKVLKTLEAASGPWYMFPLMACYVFLTAGEPPRLLASALAARKGFRYWSIVSFLAYCSCRLIGSDTMLERFKKFLASKK